MESSDTLTEAFAKLRGWLFEAVLPLWQAHGVDWENGGFHEKLEPDTRAVANVSRRTRVVARQIYSFAAAGRMGWSGDWCSAFEHGAKSLFEDCIRSDGLVVSTYTTENGIENQDFDLYDHAFALFALSELARSHQHSSRATTAAAHMLHVMNERFLAPKAGWLDSENGEMLLRSNPHMHMLEAMLALYAETGASIWLDEADRIVDTALRYFISPSTGALHEYFNLDWTFLADERGRIVEPGHQFEWSWLLRKWLAQSRIDDLNVQRAAEKLCHIGEEFGVAKSGLTIDELWDDLSPKVKTSRTWPQTERVKACLSEAKFAISTAAARQWEQKAAQAIMGILRFAHPNGCAGLWYDRLLADGSILIEPAPASSLYHIMCAAEVTHDYLAQHQKSL
jgi:mannose/cellobiose epimerase-like protein (N-acyl-D-glucosamine 2-epimerase family)